MTKLSRRSIRNKRKFIDKIKHEGRRPGIELERPVFPRPTLSVVVINTIVLTVFTIFTSPPWLPATIVQVRNANPITGYILTQNTFDTVILVNEPREVIYISTQNISTIELCSVSAESGYKIFNQTFPMLFKRIHGPNYPACPGGSRIKNGQPVENG